MPSIEAGSGQQQVALALDIGTSSTRALLFDRAGNAIPDSETQLAYDLQTTADGGAFVAPEMLRDLTFDCIDGAYRFASTSGLKIAAVGTSCFWHSLLGLDRSGRPTTPVLLWADTRAGSEVGGLRAELDRGDVHDRTGSFLHSSYWPAKLRWLRRHDPDAFAKTSRWCGFSDYLLHELTGTDATSISMASGTGMLDVRRASWDAEMAGVAGVEISALPPLPDDELIVDLRADCADRWPELSGVAWLCGIGDGAAANLGTGSITPARIALSLGTSGAMRVLIGHRPGEPLTIPADLWAYRLDRGHVLLGAAISNGGKVLAWLNELIKSDFDGDEMHQAADLKPDAHGLTFLPFLAGERSPIWNDEATAVIAGLTLSTGRPELLRCGMEAVALRFARLYAALKTVAAPEHEIVANGAALLRSPSWLQITADTLAHAIVALPPAAEASARGAAIAALAATGMIDGIGDASDPVEEATRVGPVAANAPIYQRALERQTRLERLLFPNGGSWDQQA
jgi:gluconokinase